MLFFCKIPPFYCNCVTGNLDITVIILPRINFSIALHSLYNKYFSAEIISLYIALSCPQPVSCTSSALRYKFRKRIHSAIHYIMVTLNRERGNRALVIVF